MTKMEPFRELISYEEARRIVLENVKPVERTEKVPLDEACGRVLAEDLVAEAPVPSFARASMDGYAVRAEDTYGASSSKPRKLRVVGTAYPGEPFRGEMGKGEAVQIATGCPMPRGADSVVMVEFTKEEKDIVEIQKPLYPSANVAPRGEDLEEGALALKLGVYLTPSKVGVIAALGRTAAKVYAKPIVTIVSTGKEVREVGSELGEGEIYDINSHTLSVIVSANGATPVRRGIVQDTHENLRSVIEEAVESDIIVFSGGSSVGARDLLYSVVGELGKILFHGVQLKPGKPTLFGLDGGKPLFGMPGYPTSCLSNAYLFLAPAVRKMARMPQEEPRQVRARMGHRFVSSSGRVQFLPVKIREGKAYQAFKESGAITSMSEADGYILVPLNVDVIEEGEEVDVTLLE
jgi:molybdenum cofactor synthesis domain-containing protein